MHAEATSEKIAMGWHLAGKVTAVVGTHTHVQTADDQILPGGTAYITDVGMTGPHDGIIGVEREPVINRFLTGLPSRFEAAKGMPKLHAVVITADTTTGAGHVDRADQPDPRRARSDVGSKTGRLAGIAMPSLFDDAFEDDRPPEPEREPAPRPAAAPPPVAAPAGRRPSRRPGPSTPSAS